MSLFSGMNVVSIAVPDLDHARVFYRDVLGFGPPVYDFPEAGWIEFNPGTPYGNIAVTRAEGAWAPSTQITIVLNTDDCEVSCVELRARGVRCDAPVPLPGMVTYCTFYDPLGNRLQMCSAPPA